MEWEINASTSNNNNCSRIDINGNRDKELEDEVRRGLLPGEGMMYVRVMTDEQMEVLRRQISVYATICEQLVEMHKAFTAHGDPLTGMRLGSLYCDPLMMSGGHKITGRQRWTPTIGQLQILERIFDQDNGAPSKQKIKDLTSELAQHGQISEMNVYNWFQNRRARSKRKQTAASSNTESDAEAEVESPKEKRAKPEKIHSHEDQPPRIEDNSSQSREVVSEASPKDPEHIRTQSTHPSSGSLGQASYENTQSNPRMNQPLDETDGLAWGPYYFPARRAMI